MYKRWLNVIVVDDELPLRQELRSFPWGDWGAVLAGEAENGLEALRLCRDCQPDVIVTDITMPLMNGIELTAHLKREFPAAQVILLTCHSDFEYAREALRLGALEYLVKVTLDESELERAINRAREAIEREWAHRRTALEQRRREQSKLIGRLLKDRSREDEAMASELIGSGLISKLPARLAMIKVQSGEEDRVFVEQEIQSALEAMELSASPGFSWLPVSSMEYALFFQEDEPQASQLRIRLEAVVRGLNQALDVNLPFLPNKAVIYGVISESLTNVKEYRQAFALSKLWQEAKFYEPEAAQSIFIGRPVPLSAMDKASSAQLLGPLQRYSAAESDDLIVYLQTEFVRNCLKLRYSPDDLKEGVSDFLEAWDSGGASDPELSDIRHAATLSHLVEAMVRCMERKNSQRSRLRLEIQEAKQYIEQHLHEPVTLQLLADKVALSPHYLSRLFREEIGESVHEYITRLRMELAIRLLQQTNLKVYEVAERAGIPSYRYFSTMFRSWTGVSPTEYKKQQGGQARDEGGEGR
ncbi:helix-turn-helix domain-containing protein [Paenibacillus puerhi]|uniref:helix-turn-helix domain-containing protein n=1 Tax=Paenibacillus puerhi TaxID=2692622 RepID=UPI00135CB4BB|nr:helix-turn-helix domain-containing protein [Paenibacillus puerhi]